MFYTYVLKSRSKDWLYAGLTTDLRKKFVKHSKGLVRSTKPYRPFDLVFYEVCKSKADAKRRERFLKTNKGKRTLRLMLKESLK